MSAVGLLTLAFTGPAGARTALVLLGLIATLAAIRAAGRVARVDTTMASGILVAAVPGMCALFFVYAAIRELRTPQGSPGLVLALLLGAATAGAVSGMLGWLIWKTTKRESATESDQ